MQVLKTIKALLDKAFISWEHTGSNRGPSACKADALNQLSYAPLFIGSAKIGAEPYLPKKTFTFFSSVQLNRRQTVMLAVVHKQLFDLVSPVFV